MPFRNSASDITDRNHTNGREAWTNEQPNQNGKYTKTDDGETAIEQTAADAAPTASVVVPLDGGWGWVVVGASFCCNTIVDGIVMSAGMFQEPIRNEFGASVSEVALVSSLLSGFYLIAGPFVSALANRWGFRPVTIAGAFIAAIAFCLSYFATSVLYLYITYGVIGGIGFCLIYIPAVITVGYYFERWRALATGIAMCGSGVGTFIMAPFSSYLIRELGWRGALVAQAFIILFCAICGLMFRPLKSVQITIHPEEDDTEDKERMLPVVFTKPLAEGRYAFSVPNSSHNTWIGAVSNTRYPTAAEVFRGSGANLDRRPSGTPTTPTATTTTHLNANNIHSTTKKLEQLSKAQQKQRLSSGSSTPDENHTVNIPAFNLHKELNTVGEDDENENDSLLEEDVKPSMLTARRHTVSGRRPILQMAKAGSKRAARDQALGNTRPLYRDDIFFSGSLVRIPQYKSQTSLGYHMSVTRMPNDLDVQEDEEETCKICPEAVRRTLATMLDISLLKSPSFMLLALSGFLTMMGFFVPFLYMKERATNNGMEDGLAAFTISAIGISNTVARIVCGLLSSFKGVNALYLNNIAITVGGLATIFSGYAYSATYQFTYAAIFGVAIACFSALRSIIAVDLMGLEKLTNAFGILMLFQGLAAVIGAPIAGAMYDATHSFDYSFYFAGGLITLSAILCYPLTIVNNWEKRRAEAEKEKTPAVA